MRRSYILWATIACFAMAGCIESNPQPSPLTDTNMDYPDTSVNQEVTPSDDAVVPADDINPGLDMLVPDGTAADVQDSVQLDSVDDVTTPAGCCLVDADCGSPDLFCYTDLTGFGVCLSSPVDDQCWDDSTCKEGQACLGALICACEGTCPVTVTPGLCVSDGYPCCETDDQCPASRTCKSVAFTGGTKGKKCLPAASDGSCWNDGDCGENEACADTYIKPCSTLTVNEDAPGLCIGKVDKCCDGDGDCTWGHVCLGASAEGQGSCETAPSYPSCYNNSQCGGLGTCEGGMECGCEENCISQLGTCKSGSLCCKSDLDCQDNQVCVGSETLVGGVCLDPPAAPACYRQSDCDAGSACIGATICSCTMNCVSQAGACQALPAGCCNSDSGCAEGQQCVFPFGGTQNEIGVCRDLPSPGSCYTAKNCADTEICLGAKICPCGEDCLDEAVGSCQSQDIQVCCDSDDECPVGWLCASAGKDGVCKPVPPSGQCWDTTDCGLAENCDFVQFCPCGQSCGMSDQLGTCNFYLPYGCCLSDLDCQNGSFCVNYKLGALGKCVWDNGLGNCWADSDCAEGQTCNGEFLCGCNEYCPQGDVPGMCGAPPPDGCCYSSMDCPDGTICSGSATKAGTCVPKAQLGECWSQADCYWMQGCQGASAPACGELSVPTVGKCSPMPANCCWKDADCTSGRVCRNQGYSATDLPGFCVWDPKGPACPPGELCCWNDSDCPSAHWCNGVTSCACLELCNGCGTCASVTAGTCISWDKPWE